MFVNGRGQARLGDRVVGACGHSGVIVTASQSVLANGVGVARVGDRVSGCVSGVIVAGSNNSFAG